MPENRKNPSREPGRFLILSSAKSRTRHGGAPPNGNNKPQPFPAEATPLPREPESSVHSPGLELPGKIRSLHCHGDSPLNGRSLPLGRPLLLQLDSHKGPTSMCVWLWGAEGAGVSSKANQMYVLKLGRHGGRDLGPPLILLWTVSVQDRFGGKFQFVLKAHHLSVVLA